MVKLASIAAMALLVFGCRSREVSAALEATPEATDPALEFRDIFFGCLQQEYAPARFDAMKHFVAYLPSDQMLTVERPSSANDADIIKAIDEPAKGVLASDLYNLGVGKAATPWPANTIDRVLQNQPITIVIIPGVFGEFIETRAFNEVFAEAKSSAYGRTWQDALSAYRAAGGQDQESIYSLDAMHNVSANIETLVSVASLDDQNHQPLVKAILLDTPTLSLESLGESAAIAKVFADRLAKVFAIVGTPEHIVLAGYSRGSMVALDMLVAQKHDWLQRVRSVISLAGVNFGSMVADQADDPQSKIGAQVEALIKLKEGLKPSYAAFAGNTAKWGKFLRVVAAQTIGVPGSLSEAEAQISSIKAIDLNNVGAVFLGLWRQMHLDQPIRDYPDNIRRFVLLVDSALASLEGLKTKARLQWWRNHRPPTEGIRYYSLAATMDEPDASPLSAELMRNPYTTDPDSYDQKSLLSAYRDFVKATHIRLNDSQVTPARAHIWPGIVEALNGQKLDSQLLAVVGVHHWGIVLPVVAKMDNGSVNPFPRRALLKALATVVARDLDARSH